MLRRANNGKRLSIVLGLVAAAALFGAGIALAAHQTIIGQSDNTFSASTYTTDQGEVGTLQVNGSSHNVTANDAGPDGKALFRSATISGGTTAVNGTQYLTPGSYKFFCSIHPTTMQGNLVVTGNGTPQPRPSARLTVVSKKIGKVAKKGNLLVGVNMTAAVDGASLTATLGKATIGRVNSVSLAAGQQNEVVKLSKSGKNKLARKAKATVTVSAEIPFGSPATAKGKLK